MGGPSFGASCRFGSYLVCAALAGGCLRHAQPQRRALTIVGTTTVTVAVGDVIALRVDGGEIKGNYRGVYREEITLRSWTANQPKCEEKPQPVRWEYDPKSLPPQVACIAPETVRAVEVFGSDPAWLAAGLGASIGLVAFLAPCLRVALSEMDDIGGLIPSCLTWSLAPGLAGAFIGALLADTPKSEVYGLDQWRLGYEKVPPPKSSW